MRKPWKILFWCYVAFDLFIGYGGILPLSLLAGAQGTPPGPPVQLVTNKAWFLPGQPNPQQVPSANIALSGNPGPQTYFYWIVSRYLVGNSSPAGPFVILNAANPLSASTFDVVNWTAVSDSGVTYDVLRTTTPLMPSGVCNCAVATNVTSPVNDQSNALGAYTVTTLDPNTLNITLTNEVQGAGSAHLILRLNGVQVSDLSTAGATTTINPTNGVIPVRSNAFTFIDSPLSVSGGNVSNSGQLFGPNGTICAAPTYSFTNGTNSGVVFGTGNSGKTLLCGGGFPGAEISGGNGFTLPFNAPLMFATTNLVNGNTIIGTSLGPVIAGTLCAGVSNSVTDCTGALGATLHEVTLTATAALTAGQVVKLDSANNNSVVVATTGDTGGGIAIGIVANSPGAAAQALVVVSGNIATPLLGTGTCTKGQFVIVDTTTNGRVKCTGTYTAGTVIGTVTVAQAAVGSALSVMVGLR